MAIVPAPPECIMPYGTTQSAPPHRRARVRAPADHKMRKMVSAYNGMFLGPAHGFANMAPTPASARNAPMPVTTSSYALVSAHSARLASTATNATARTSVIDHGRMLERQAQERLARARARLVREETKRSSMAAAEQMHATRLEEAARHRAEMAVLHGKDLLNRLANIPKASPDKVLELSQLFNVHLANHLGFVGPSSVNKLWKMMLVPEDGSTWGDAPPRTGSMCYADFERVVRNVLQLSSATMPQERLLGLWRALDADGNGLVNQGEFVRFMRFGSADTNARASVESFRQHDTESTLTPQRSRISANGENPDARKKERARRRALQRAQQRDEREMQSIYDSCEARAKQLANEAARFEAQLAALDTSKGSGTPRLPKIDA